MGSDLYAAVNVRYPDGEATGAKHRSTSYFADFIKGTWCLARGIIVEAFGSSAEDVPWGTHHYVGEGDACHSERKSEDDLHALGYLTSEEIRDAQGHEEDCPWWKDEPYWVRKLDGREFVAIIREKRWQKLQDGAFADRECGPELRSLAASVESLLSEGLDVRVWVWHSQ